MRAMQQQWRQPLLLIIQLMGATPPPASTTALGLPVDGSNLLEEGDVTDAGSVGNDVGPTGVGATDTPSMPPVQQSTLFPIFQQGNVRIVQSPATTATGRDKRSISSMVDRGSGTTALADRPPAACDASESENAAAPTSSLSAAVAHTSTSASAEMRTTPRASPPPAALAAPPAYAVCNASGIEMAGGDVKGVAQRPLTSLPLCAVIETTQMAETRMTPWVSTPPAALAAPLANAVCNALGIEMAGGAVKGVAQRALMPFPLRTVVKTTQTVTADPVARAGAEVCTDGCASGTCSNTHAWTFIPAAILATAPTVASPYWNVTTGTVANDSGREAAQHTRGHFLPRQCTEAELRAEDPQLQRLTDADRWLYSVFGDTIHQNDGTHLDDGIGVADNTKWQRLHLRVAACNLPLYDLPNGCWAHRFLEALMNLWVGVVKRCWNSKCPLVFQACIIWRVRGISSFQDAKPIIWG